MPPLCPGSFAQNFGAILLWVSMLVRHRPSITAKNNFRNLVGSQMAVPSSATPTLASLQTAPVQAIVYALLYFGRALGWIFHMGAENSLSAIRPVVVAQNPIFKRPVSRNAQVP